MPKLLASFKPGKSYADYLKQTKDPLYRPYKKYLIQKDGRLQYSNRLIMGFNKKI